MLAANPPAVIRRRVDFLRLTAYLPIMNPTTRGIRNVVSSDPDHNSEYGTWSEPVDFEPLWPFGGEL